MPKITKSSNKVGLPPGALVHVGKKREGKVKITIIDYNEKEFQEKEVESVEECFSNKDHPNVTWINIDGIHEIDIIDKIGKHFGIHPLILEDILNTAHRPKMEDLGDYIFIVLKMLYFDDEEKMVKTEQVSLVLENNLVISFQEIKGDVFNPIRERIRNYKGRIRKTGCDYLAYALVDAIVDNYFIILEKIGEEIESLEEDLINDPNPKTLHIIHGLKREMIFLRKSVWPLREVINALERGESPLINESTRIYLKDVYDHTIQVIDTTETFRDVISGMLDTYLSVVSNKMNEVMKVLTIIATIFIPLTFIAGIYGMNFEYMPELGWHLGYFMVWFVMAIVAVLMVFYFKKKAWL